MRIQRLWRYSRLGLLLFVVGLIFAPATFAQTSSSSNYKVDETQFGAGSAAQTCSASYCSKTSIGDATSGPTANTVHTATFGSITPNEPLVEMIIEPGISNLGDLTTEQTATKTMIVKIRTYLSDGYYLQIVGDPPKYGGHTLNTLSLATASSAGTEQFGINAVANSSPSVGANLVQVPDSNTSFGVVNSGYDTANQFKYNSGDTIAHSDKETGQTDYT
ncbi:MAG: hypothetical protein WAW80_00400, partial [Candidatus Saccharimonadales bacterium]